MIDPDPRYRFTPTETYVHLSSIYNINKIKIKKENIIDYLDKQTLKNLVSKFKISIPEPLKMADNKILYNSIIKNSSLLIK
jgi:hypothetical protein